MNSYMRFFKRCFLISLLLIVGFSSHVPQSFAVQSNANIISSVQDNSSPISFHPTPGDVSIVFLGNIFGVVDGVLAGSGSQIIGKMLGVFNSAILAFGGFILLYTLVVSTSSTAHEGQMLGQKWSSIWLPLRSFVGVGTILPLTSGYCVMQIFVMWLVVQGVGAADSVWGAALSYLNRGGSIIQKPMNSAHSANADGGKIMDGAMGILVAQSCMNALEVSYKQYYKNNCGANISDSPSADLLAFCDIPVPSFINSVDIVSDANNALMLQGSRISQSMPYFTDASDGFYQGLTGICGQISWDTFILKNPDSTLSKNELETIQNSRSIAVLQMYQALLPVADSMASNYDLFNTSFDCTNNTAVCASNYVMTSFGQPLKPDYKSGCDAKQGFNNDSACINWGNTQQQPVLFNGRELQDAVAAYNGVMLPSLSIDALNGNKSAKKHYKKYRSFINQAKSQGWLMAGAYYFRLALLNNFMNQKPEAGANQTDTTSNMAFTEPAGNAWSLTYFINRINKDGADSEGNICSLSSVSGVSYKPTCLPFENESSFNDIGIFLAGSNFHSATLPLNSNNLNFDGTVPTWYTESDNNVYTYIINANSMALPNVTTALDAGMNENAASNFNPSFNTPSATTEISGGKWGIPGKAISFLWNKGVVPILDIFNMVVISFTQQLLSLVLTPLTSMVGTIFYNALNVMRMDGVNPIISIAIMGTQFIDGVGNAWIALVLYASINAMTVVGLLVMIPLMPLVTVWMSIMLGVGFTAAFYVPFVPFLIFSFAGIGWLISVIESMVAAPIVGLAVIMPDGHDVMGKGEEGIMLLLNVFLRPSMMILGYIFAIILSYVGVWVLNSSFNYALNDFMHLPPMTSSNFGQTIVSKKSDAHYGFWSSTFVLYFAILTYVSSYMAIVQNAFELIYYLPDKVLRWISGGVQEQFGSGTVTSMLDEVKQESSTMSQAAVGAMGKAMSNLQQGLEKMDEDDDDEEGEGEGEEGGEASGATAK